jgi:hypothetical protein
MSSIAVSTPSFLSGPARALNPNYDPSNPTAAPLYADGSQASADLIPGLNGHETEYFKSEITRLDSASGTEKGSFQWAYARAAAQVAYNSNFADDVNKDAPRENLDSANPVVNVIVAAMEKQKSDLENAGSQQSALNPADRYLPLQSFGDLKQQSWFKGFASQLDAALQTQVPVQTYKVSKYA